MQDKARIIKVKKNPEGDITDVMLQNGNVYSINEAITMVRDGLIAGMSIGHSKNGREYLRSNPNEIQGDNLDSMPTF